MKKTAIKKLVELAEYNESIILIAGDLGYGILDEFREKFPKQFINAGICEQNMASLAAGLAKEGKRVFTYSIANFPTLRCLEQIRNDIAYHNMPVTTMAVGGGLAYGSLGMSHHSTEDIAVMRAIPNMTVLVPGDRIETKACMDYAYRSKEPCYLRLGKNEETKLPIKNRNLLVHTPQIILEGTQILIFACGAILEEAYKACLKLREQAIDCGLFSFPCIKPLDSKVILEHSMKAKLIVTVEDHNIIGGLGSAIAETISEASGVQAKLLRLGLKDTFSSVVGSQQYLWKQYGIDSDQILNSTLKRYGDLT